MQTIYVCCDMPERYDPMGDYTEYAVPCTVLVETEEGKRGREQLYRKDVTLQRLPYVLLSAAERDRRSRCICSHGRLLAKWSGIHSLLSRSELLLREINGEYVSRDNGNVGKFPGLLSVQERYPLLCCYSISELGHELDLVGIENYGINWEDDCTAVREYSSTGDSVSTYTCKYMPDYQEEGVYLLRRLVHEYGEVCRKHRLGNPTTTYAGQGKASYYQVKGVHPFRNTTEPQALNLECAAYFGGRTQPFGYGRYEGECSLYDISAYYPSICTRVKLPTKLVGYSADVSLEGLKAKLSTHYCIASVTLQDCKGLYPQHKGFTVVYPLESCYTFLHHAELQLAVQRGDIVSVHQLAWYDSDYVLKSWAEHMLSARGTCERTGQNLHAHYLKVIANGWCGKLGSRSSAWEDRPDIVPPDLDCQWTQCQVGSSNLMYLRSIAGRVQEKREDLLPYHGSIAVAGAITAYGREQLWRTIEYAGLHETLYCSTDSLICSKVGSRRLDYLCGTNGWEAGRLRKVEVANGATIAGHGIYSIGGRIATQGFARESAGRAIHGGGVMCRGEEGIHPGIEGGYDPESSPLQHSLAAIMSRAERQPWTSYYPE